MEIYASEETGDESAMAETLDSESSAERIRYRGRVGKKDKKEKKERKHRHRSRYPSTFLSRSPPIRRSRSRARRSNSRKPAAKDIDPKTARFERSLEDTV